MASVTGNKSNRNCAVYGCSSVNKKNPELGFHSFPPEGQKVSITNDFGELETCNRRQLWQHKLKIGKKITVNMKVCSLHFKDEDFVHSGCKLWTGRKVLSASAIPSLNLPQSSIVTVHEEKKRNINHKRAQRLISRQSQKENKSQKAEELVDRTPENSSECLNDHLGAAQTLLFLSEQESKCKDAYTQTDRLENCTCFETKSTKDQAVQVETKVIISVSDFVKTDKQLNSVTGIHSFTFFNRLVFLLSTLSPDKRVHRLSMFNRLFLSLMKLKLDMPYVVLSILFGVSSQTCKNIFCEVIPKLACVLRSVIQFLSAEEIKNNIPKCFMDFRKVRIILDCIELSVQQHKRLCCRIKCYSHYKGTTTLKFMTGVSPAGVITYVSPMYGGRTSDKAIFERSGILEQLTNEDQIMVDKGFLIEQLCECYGIKIVRPPFLKNKKQLSQSEAIKSAKIASARVHIERTNARIRIFKILSNKISIEMIPLMEDIFNIVCGIVNLSNPILADNKFICFDS